MKIIHCADLHLNSKLESNLGASKAKIRKIEVREAFLRMVKYGAENGASVIIIAGDMFDSDIVLDSTGDYVLDIIRENSSIDFLYLNGNHDSGTKVFGTREIPENLKIFGESWTSFNYGDIEITGVQTTSYNEHDIYNTLLLNDDKFNIVVLHGDAVQQSGKDMVNLSLLKNRSVDYLALGHIHKNRLERLDSRGVYAFSGCLEGRGFDECGEKGFYLLDINDKKLNAEFIVSSERVLYDVAVDITDCKTVRDIEIEAEKCTRGIPKNSMVKLTLTGFFTVDTQKDAESLCKHFENSFFFVKVKDSSKLKIKPDDYINDVSLKGEFIRTVLKAKLSAEDRQQIITLGIAALSGEEL